MHYCTDRIIEKRLISGFEYSNDRKGTQVSLAWVRFTPVMQLLQAQGLGMFCVNMEAVLTWKPLDQYQFNLN